MESITVTPLITIYEELLIKGSVSSAGGCSRSSSHGHSGAGQPRTR